MKSNEILATGRLIEAVMRYRGLSVSDFAAAIGEHKMNAYKILNGSRPVSNALAVKIGNVLNMSPMVILSSANLELLEMI